jgi:HAT1-interacting factor 1
MAENKETVETMASESPAANDTLNSIKVSLADLCAKGTSHFAHKHYEEAADYFARASELQAELNGEMDSGNAEVLFLYGRSLFKVGQSKSDVLGGRASGQKKSDGGAEPRREDQQQGKSSAAQLSTELDRIPEDGVTLVEEKNGVEAEQENSLGSKRPLFQFTGDENFEDSDDEDNVSLSSLFESKEPEYVTSQC